MTVDAKVIAANRILRLHDKIITRQHKINLLTEYNPNGKNDQAIRNLEIEISVLEFDIIGTKI